MTYRELKDRQQKEIDSFPMMWAFSEKQLKEGMEKLGVKDMGELKAIAPSGFVRKTDYKALWDLIHRHQQELKDEIEADKTGEGFIYDMFYTELANHEYSYTGDPTEALRACSIQPLQIEKDPRLNKGFCKAVKELEAEAE